MTTCTHAHDMHDLIVHYSNGEESVVHNVNSDMRVEMACRIAHEIVADYDGIEIVGFTHITD